MAWELWAVSTLAEESRQLPIGYFLSLSYKTQYFLAILSNNTSWININPRKKRKKEAKKSEWSGSLHLKWMSTNTGKKKKKVENVKWKTRTQSPNTHWGENAEKNTTFARFSISDKIPLSSVIKENSVSRNQVQVKQINKWKDILITDYLSRKPPTL